MIDVGSLEGMVKVRVKQNVRKPVLSINQPVPEEFQQSRPTVQDRINIMFARRFFYDYLWQIFVEKNKIKLLPFTE